MTDSVDVPAPYEQMAAMSEADLFKFIVETCDYEAANIRQNMPINMLYYKHPEWGSMAVRRHHVFCAISDLMSKWITAVEEKPVPFLTRDADILRAKILAEMKKLDPALGNKS
jgi:hypothetical protein